MTQYEIKLIFRAHAYADFSDTHDERPLFRETIFKFYDMGLLENGQATDKLHAYCKFLCDMPMPIQQWVVPGQQGFFSAQPKINTNALRAESAEVANLEDVGGVV